MDPKLLEAAAERFREEGRLIRLPEGETIVFVGDTHGDREATEQVFDRFSLSEHVLVFLGDYLDRGPDSEGNLELLLEAKLAHPDRVFLLMGNHEGWLVSPFSPADFWHSLPPYLQQEYAEALAWLPFAAWHPKGLLALHGALPDVDEVDEIARIPLGSEDWRKMAWGDWADVPGYSAGDYFGRPTFGRDFFNEVMSRLGLRALVRSHQPHAPLYLFEGRCLTIFTSSAYGGGERSVALLRPGRPLRDARDLELISI
ncbi:serine/threonine protein phosphatase [Candidatus Bipolaricaulota bacterium]|nr:serine/threonine protein phosphatase [Candidatus Bipolaricaulota bacterium]